MTVTTTKAEQTHTGNGAATSFATNFKLLNSSDLVVKTRVIATGVESVKTLGVDYSISGIGADAGATVTYPLSGDELPATEEIILIREVAFSQTTSIRNQSGFFPAVLEDAYDLTVMMAQQNKAQTDRALKLPIGNTINPDIPIIGAGRVIAVNAAGTAFEQGPSITEIENAVPDAEEAARTVIDEEDFTPDGTWNFGVGDPTKFFINGVNLGTAAYVNVSTNTDFTVSPTALAARGTIATYVSDNTGTDLLGTDDMTGGKSGTLSGLDLTPYKFVRIALTDLRADATADAPVRVGDNVISSGFASLGNVNATDRLSIVVDVDLNTGLMLINTAQATSGTLVTSLISTSTVIRASVFFPVDSFIDLAEGTLRAWGIR